MNTLREIGAFIGVARGLSMRSVSQIVPLLSGAERTSMRSMILGLQKLPPITLGVEVVGNRFGDVPFTPVFRVAPSGGVVLQTRIFLLANGPQPEVSVLVDNAGTFSPITLRFTGIFSMEVQRTGITSTGVTSLVEKFHVEAVEKGPEPPSDPTPPFIAVQSKGDGSFTITGNGFLPSATVHILVGNGTLTQPLAFVDTSAPDGRLLGFQTGKICQPQRQLFFVANDGRLKPSNHSQLDSNTVTVTCPF